MLKHQLILIGAGGHSKVLIEALRCVSAPILGCVDNKADKVGANVMDVPIVGTDIDLEKYSPETYYLINGLGSAGNISFRREVFERFKGKGYFFSQVIHPSATIASHVSLDEGVQIMAGAVIQPSVKIGRNSLVNTSSSVDHDCEIGAHVHLAPGVTVSGGVVIGDGVHVGTGAKVIQGIKIGHGAVIAAGSVVVANVPDGAKVLGVPAKEGLT